jgi:hypothetical protein
MEHSKNTILQLQSQSGHHMIRQDMFQDMLHAQERIGGAGEVAAIFLAAHLPVRARPLVPRPLVIPRRDGAPMDGVGAWHPDGLQDFLERDAAVVAAGNGARVAPELVRQPAVAGRTDHMPD